MDLILLANHFYFQFLLACDVAEAVSKGVFNLSFAIFYTKNP